jgi:CRISPR/Cas system-associated exonuclease Cas4 (RecB family)
MNFSYTQVSQFLSCPRRYRYQYLDGWKEKDTRAAMLFGRAFEKALAAFFLRQDASETLFNEWASYRDLDLQYSANNNWDRMLQGGMQLLDRFAQEDRVRIVQPQTNLQVKILRPLPGDHTFISYVDAIGELDNELCVIDWKTSTSCYPAEPAGLCALDPQMICYSWMTGIERVALVVFVRKRMPEIQYIKATISDQQRQEYGRLVEETVRQIEAAQFLQHSGIRFPQNPCVSCAYIGLCLDRREMVDLRLTRQQGAALDWLDELAF